MNALHSLRPNACNFHKGRQLWRVPVWIWLPMLIVPMAANAQDAPAGLDSLVRMMETTSSTMSDSIAGVAIRFLYALAAIEFAWTFAKGTIQGEGLSALLSKLIVRLVFVGVLVLCLNFGDQLVRLVIDSAIAVARTGGSTTEPSPSAILSQALGMIGRLLGDVSVLSPGHSIGLILISIAVAMTAAAMAAFVVVVYAELYLAAVAGLLGLGFGGLDATRDIAMSYLRMLIGMGFKLLTLLIVNGMVMATLETTFEPDGDLFSAIQVLIIQVVGLVLVLRLPSVVERIVSGAGGGSSAGMIGGLVGSAAWGATRAAGRTAGGAAYGGVKGGVNAARAASLEAMTASALGVPPPGGLAGAMAKAGPVAKGVARGAASGALSSVSGNGPQQRARRDILDWLDRPQRRNDG